MELELRLLALLAAPSVKEDSETSPRLTASWSSWTIDHLLSVCLQQPQALHDLCDTSVPEGGRFGAIKAPTHFDVCVCIQKKHTITYRKICTWSRVHMCMNVEAKYNQIHSNMHRTTSAYLNVYRQEIQSDTNRYAPQKQVHICWYVDLKYIHIHADMHFYIGAYLTVSSCMNTAISKHTYTYARDTKMG